MFKLRIRFWKEKQKKALEDYWQVEGYSDTQMVAFNVKSEVTMERTKMFGFR